MIRMRQISRTFTRPDGSRLEILRGIDCDVETGDFVAVVGPSGSGKSTFMNILGLLDRPDGGEYRLAGEDVAGLEPARLARLRNRHIGFVFQQFHLLPKTTALENVELPLVYSDVDRPRERAGEALRRVGLEDRMDHFPSELSGGQQQRVAIARALVTDPDLILADEPTGNLDRDSASGVLELLHDLNGSGRTIVLVTHDHEIASGCGVVWRIDGGSLLREPVA